AGVVVTFLVMLVTARMDRLDRVGAVGAGLELLVWIAMPSVWFWSDRFYRSIAIVWTVAAVLWVMGTFGYYWWLVVMLVFVWVAFFRERGRVVVGFGMLTCSFAIAAVIVPVVAAVVPPADGPAVLVCLRTDASETNNAVFSAVDKAQFGRDLRSTSATRDQRGVSVVRVEFDR